MVCGQLIQPEILHVQGTLQGDSGHSMSAWAADGSPLGQQTRLPDLSGARRSRSAHDRGCAGESTRVCGCLTHRQGHGSIGSVHSRAVLPSGARECR